MGSIRGFLGEKALETALTDNMPANVTKQPTSTVEAIPISHMHVDIVGSFPVACGGSSPQGYLSYNMLGDIHAWP